ncbi:MAG: hypothetical protein KF730_14965 [Sphingomonas sp.]|uniref:DUF47 domain-containing protein n=1 Tax=Sphingomonas sp. TaxID=28214 RepID=UPI0025D35899|nr:hypothetical protein [Sphingomonas sp.]MBX3565867.1 hypothetical protein [Sphingomonas sp.]
MPDTGVAQGAEQASLIAIYDKQALLLAEAGGALAGLFMGRGARDLHLVAIVRHEKEAGALSRDFWCEAGLACIDPQDRSVVAGLFAALEGVFGDMKQAALAIRRYGISDPDPGMQALSHVLVDAIDTAGMAIPLLRSASRYRERLIGAGTTLREEGTLFDDLHDTGLRTLFEASSDAREFIARREVYAHLKGMADGLDRVAATLERIAA